VFLRTNYYNFYIVCPSILHILTLLFTIIMYCVQFLIDTSNRQQVAAATIQLLEILTSSPLQASSVLIVLNKRSVLSTIFVNFIICDQIINRAGTNFQVFCKFFKNIAKIGSQVFHKFLSRYSHDFFDNLHTFIV